MARSSFDPTLVRRVLRSADGLGYPSLRMVSGAGHDASYLNQVCPAAMIFVPGKAQATLFGYPQIRSEQHGWARKSSHPEGLRPERAIAALLGLPILPVLLAPHALRLPRYGSNASREQL